MDAGGGMGPHAMLFRVYALTSLFAALVSSKASAVLMFPIAMEIAMSIGMNKRKLIMGVDFEED